MTDVIVTGLAMCGMWFLGAITGALVARAMMRRVDSTANRK